MTHQKDYTLKDKLVEELLANGLEGLPGLIRVLLNAGMQAERERYLQAGEYERTENRQGYANGFKPKTVKTRVERSPLQCRKCGKEAFTHPRWRRDCAVSEP